MNIVFHRYGNICESDIIESFKKLGLNIIEDDLEITCKSIEGAKRVETISRLILERQPLFVFSINFFPYISEVCQRLGVTYICWTVDSPVFELYSRSIKNDINRVFLFDHKQYLSLKKLNIDNVFYLPLATNTDRWKNVLGDVEIIPQYDYDTSFVGSLYTDNSLYRKLNISEDLRNEISELLNAQIDKDGLDLIESNISDDMVNSIWKAYKDYDSNNRDYMESDDSLIDSKRFFVINNILGFELSAMQRIAVMDRVSSGHKIHVFTKSVFDTSKNLIIHGAVSTHTEMPKVFYGSKINLNITMRGIQTGMPQRIWDILGCGGFLLTDYREEITEYFEDGKDLVCYRTEHECAEMIDYYLTHDQERESIAGNGHKKVSLFHTYDLRVSQMLKTAFKNYA